MQIIEFQAENYKRLKAIKIRPDGNLVMIGGANAQGKSSVLDAIYAVLKGGSASRETVQPIRDGQDVAWARLDIGDGRGNVKYIAIRRWTKDDAGTLTVSSADGAKYSSPQKLLDDTMGPISFDPLAFLKQDAKGQVATLVAALGPSLGFDPDELEAGRKAVFEARTKLGQDVKRLEGQLAGYAEYDPALPTEETPASTLMAEWQAATAHNETRRRAWQKVADYNDDVTKSRLAVEDAERALDRARDRHAFLVQEANEAEKSAAALAPDAGVDAIRARLDDVDATNAKIRAQQHRAAVAAELSDRKHDVAQHTLKLQEIAKQKEDAISAAPLPIDGLSFNDEGVTFKGIPFSQSSNAERFRVSAALAMSANPDLRVMRIDNGESLDSASMAVIQELAEEHDYQVWITRVDESGEVGFTIEDGSLLSQPAAVSA